MRNRVNGECAAVRADSRIALTVASERSMLSTDTEERLVIEQKSCAAGESRCPACGAAFECGYAAGQSRCWCFELPSVRVNDESAGCLCPRCLAQRLEDDRKARETASAS